LELSKIVAAARQTIETAGARVMISSLAESDSRVSFLMRAEDVARSVVALHRQFVIKNVRSETGEKRIPLTELEAYGAD
jgi:aspartokinase